MNRQYVVVLFSFCFFVGSGVLYWWGKQEAERAREVTFMASGLESATAVIEEDLQATLDLQRERLAESGWKHEVFAPIRHTCERMRVSLDQYSNLSIIELDENLKTLVNNCADTIQTHHQRLELSEHWLDERIQSIQNIYLEFEQKQKDVNTVSKEAQRHLLQFHYLTALRDLANRVISITGSRTIICDSPFPVLNADRSLYRKDQGGRAIIGIGAYSSAYNSENVRIMVNGVAYKPGPDGRVAFDMPTSERGENTLELECIVQNPLTGQVRTGEGSYTYFVR